MAQEESESTSRLTSRVEAWARRDPRVRAALLMGSRARAELASRAGDLDFIIVVDEVEPFRGGEWVKQLATPVIFYWEMAAFGNLKFSLLVDDLLPVDFAMLPASSGAEGVICWLTPPEGGRPAFARPLYDEAGIGGPLAAALQDPSAAHPNIPEPRYRWLVNRFWYVTLGATLRAERGQLWYPHLVWGGLLLSTITRLFGWVHWDRASAADPFRQGRRLETWAEPDDVERLLGLVKVSSPERMVDTLYRTALTFEALSRACAERYGFEYPVCAHDVILERIARAKRSLPVIGKRAELDALLSRFETVPDTLSEDDQEAPDPTTAVWTQVGATVSDSISALAKGDRAEQVRSLRNLADAAGTLADSLDQASRTAIRRS